MDVRPAVHTNPVTGIKHPRSVPVSRDTPEGHTIKMNKSLRVEVK